MQKKNTRKFEIAQLQAEAVKTERFALVGLTPLIAFQHKHSPLFHTRDFTRTPFRGLFPVVLAAGFFRSRRLSRSVQSVQYLSSVFDGN